MKPLLLKLNVQILNLVEMIVATLNSVLDINSISTE